MDVVCSRCRAEYEFDEALIASRGTTVRCTACGLQFRVYPAEGVLIDDRWVVMDPDDSVGTEQRFKTLAQLQQAIVRGEVSSHHLLSRAGRAPRPLSTILELQPLLRQRKSDLSQLRKEDENSEAADTFHDDIPEDAIVPSDPPEPIDGYLSSRATPPPSSGSASGSSPRIRSVLSPVVERAPASEPSGFASPGSRNFRQERRSTLQTVSSTPQALRDALARPEVEQSGLPEVGKRKLPSSPAFSVEPRISEFDPLPGKMTPTPGPLRAYRRVDTAPMSSVPGIPASRHARSGGVVLSVLVGGALFLGFANRHRLSDLLATQNEVSKELPENPQEEALLQQKLQAAQVVWLGQRLFGRPTDAAKDAQRLSELHLALTRSSSTPSWDLVNVLLAQGRVTEARQAASGLSPSAASAYSLALLDLAEASDSPPWVVIVDRLKEASIGERGLFLARIAYIYSLSESGQPVRAQADFEAFSRINGAQTSPLYKDLDSYLRAVQGRAQASGEQDPQEPLAGNNQIPAPPAAETPKIAKLIPSLELKMTQADQMWSEGSHSEALVLYREIVSQMGTSHPAGSRAAQRIREFEDMNKNETQGEEE